MPPTRASAGRIMLMRMVSMPSDGAGHQFPGFTFKGSVAQGVQRVLAGGSDVPIVQGPPGPAAMGLRLVAPLRGQRAKVQRNRFATLQAVGTLPSAFRGKFADEARVDVALGPVLVDG